MSVCFVCWCRLLWSSHIRLLLVFFICTSHTLRTARAYTLTKPLAVTQAALSHTHMNYRATRYDASETAKLCVRHQTNEFPERIPMDRERLNEWENDKYAVTWCVSALMSVSHSTTIRKNHWEKRLNASTEAIHFQIEFSSEIPLMRMLRLEMKKENELQ